MSNHDLRIGFSRRKFLSKASAAVAVGSFTSSLAAAPTAKAAGGGMAASVVSHR